MSIDDARPEFTWRAVLVGIAIALMVGAAYPYVVLKIGFGPNISVVSAFLGFLVLGALGKATSWGGKDRRSNRFEYNLVQTAGTAAGQAGFMCVVLAAFDMLSTRPALHLNIHPTMFQVFLWLSVAGSLGVLLAVPLRKHYIDEEELPFADGVAAGETLVLLDQDLRGAKRRVSVFALGGASSALVTWLRDGSGILAQGVSFFGAWGAKLNVGLSFSMLSFGSGFLVGLRVVLSMGMGMFVGWYVLPGILVRHHFIPEATFASTLRWTMWPATGLMVSGGLTALVLKWRVVAKTFRDLRFAESKEDFPLRWVGVGSALLAVMLVVLQWLSMGIRPWESAVAILISIPLMLVGTRVLGETNWAPISIMANMVQAVFAVLSPGNVGVNMVASGMSGSVASNGEHLMQDYKAGKIIGSNNRYLTYMQLIAVPVGALALCLVYPLLRREYGIGPERYGIDPARVGMGGETLTSPISVKWAGFAELLSGGLEKLPPYCLHALVVSLVLGVLMTLAEQRYRRLSLSPTGLGLGMLIPANAMLPMLIGGGVQAVWKWLLPRNESELRTPLASGLIVGEALLALVVPLARSLGH